MQKENSLSNHMKVENMMLHAIPFGDKNRKFFSILPSFQARVAVSQDDAFAQPME